MPKTHQASPPTSPAYRLIHYDYRHQAWLVNGKYVACGHDKPCDCYGTLHAGQPPAPDADIH